jgi:hypothetical protein
MINLLNFCIKFLFKGTRALTVCIRIMRPLQYRRLRLWPKPVCGTKNEGEEKKPRIDSYLVHLSLHILKC